MALRRPIRFAPSPGFVTLQFLIFMHISVEVGMGVMLLVQAKPNRVHGVAKCHSVVVQSSILVTLEAPGWTASRGSPQGLVCHWGCCCLLQITRWRAEGAWKAVRRMMHYYTKYFPFLFWRHFSSTVVHQLQALWRAVSSGEAGQYLWGNLNHLAFLL